MTKTFQDTWGDRLQVVTLIHGGGLVFLNNGQVAKPADRLTVDYSFEPDEARRLAKAIKKAAKRARAAR